ncbi:MAG: polysaccharide biosynthesis protein [Gammaproteobacteria bacterium]|nr:polysaccharide biosynthesis protein [Gammaproteobacteria bacterium]
MDENKTPAATDRLRDILIHWPRLRKSALVVAIDLAGFAVCGGSALWLVLGLATRTWTSAGHLLLIAATSVIIAWLLGLYRSVIRYMGVDLLAVGGSTAAYATGAGFVTTLAIAPDVPSVRWAVAFFGFSFLYITGSRYAARLMLIPSKPGRAVRNVLIYGAGSAGAQLAISLRGHPDVNAIAMIDDDPALSGQRVKGLEVYPSAAIDSVIHHTKAESVLLAIPSASRRRRRQVLERLAELPVHVQTIPDFRDIISGKARVDDISEVDVNDLLGRDPVPPDPALLDACILRKSVLVTGAGGSIGSELCRQILEQGPVRLVLFEISETALYSVERKLKEQAAKIGSDCNIVSLLGSVHHEARMREVVNTFDIQTIYHAAAYKHVPIVEQNVFEGIHNNVLGTLHTVRAALDGGVENFVLISTDKAVNPTSVMGATKRLAELVVQAHAKEYDRTGYCMVRFGNVLESSGSVVPLFKEQIRAGGPVTVTHRDIIRYFMTIPEAAELVLQAGSMAQGGDVFVLDMGEPVRIRDLAYRMIKLMGLTVRDESHPDGDIEIRYIGLRPAEKLYEELLIGANVTGTAHQRILRAHEEFLPLNVLNQSLTSMARVSRDQDYLQARETLMEAVREYQPSNEIEDHLWAGRTGTDGPAVRGKVLDFPPKS